MHASWGRIRRSATELVVAEPPASAWPTADGTTELHVMLLDALATLPVRDQATTVRT